VIATDPSYELCVASVMHLDLRRERITVAYCINSDSVTSAVFCLYWFLEIHQTAYSLSTNRDKESHHTTRLIVIELQPLGGARRYRYRCVPVAYTLVRRYSSKDHRFVFLGFSHVRSVYYPCFRFTLRSEILLRRTTHYRAS
jgi:hypothetical protein